MRSPIGRRWRWPVLLAALALALAACGGDGTDDTDVEDTNDTEGDVAEDEESGGSVEGGTILFGDTQVPTTLNSFLSDASSPVTANFWPRMYTRKPDFSYEPYLLDGEAEFTEDPFTVTYNLREDAIWSDGEPIDAEDVALTFETIVADGYSEQMTDTAGYDLITDYDINGEKSITFNFSGPFAAWKLLFDEILPKHVLEGEDFLTVMNDELPKISGGPFIFDSWDRGRQLRLVRNDNFWLSDVALDEIVMRYLPDTTTLTQQMLGGELDMYNPEPEIELLDQLKGASDRIAYEVGSGTAWEHLAFNTLVPGLDQTFIRQAIAMGINRQQIVETLLQPIDPEAVVLQNPFWMASTDPSGGAYDQWEYDPDGAQALLEENGCEPGDDGVHVCDDVRLSFRVGTTGGNDRRELTQQLMRASLAEVGIEINIVNGEGASFFELLNTPEHCDGLCDYDIALFPWSGSSDPSRFANLYGCDGFDEGEPQVRPQNFQAFCDEELTDLMDTANATVDPEENARLWNEAAQVMADNVPILPLFRQPQLLAYTNTLTGPQLNAATTATRFWNSHEWAYTE